MPEEDRSSPALLLALEEALLDYCEEHEHPGFLRFWESPRPFVVLGYSKRTAEEVHLPACEAEGIPVLRRSSGGGTVLQGPGCFNYTLVLPIDSDPAFETISTTNRHVMERHRAALQTLLRREVAVAGHTDLVLGPRKFSGNAQRRKRRCFLFHGSFLLGMDLSLIERTLQLPEQQPEYRARRTHADFLVNLTLPRETLQAALRACWPTADFRPFADDLPPEIHRAAAALVQAKYGCQEWNFKF